MRIQELKINHFGKLKSCELSLKEQINIIYGKNEAGKSTLMQCITSLLYGLSKAKRGKDKSDYDAFKPWTGDDFSAKMQYKLQKGEEFEIYRDFSKRAAIVYNSHSQDISNQYPIDKTKGNLFFIEQAKIDEEAFLTSVAIKQQEVRLGTQEQNSIIQRIANLASTGQENVSFQKSMTKLNKRQLEEIGTLRSQDRPINKVEERIQELENQTRQIGQIQERLANLQEEKQVRKQEIREKEETRQLLEKLKKEQEREQIEQEKLQVNKDIIVQIQKQENEQIETRKQIQEQKTKTRKEKEQNFFHKPYLLLVTCLFLLTVFSPFVLNSRFIPNILGFLTILTGIIYLFCYRKAKRKMKEQQKQEEERQKETLQEIQKIDTQIELLKQSRNQKEKEVQKQTEEFSMKQSQIIEQITEGKISKQEAIWLIQNPELRQNYTLIEKQLNEIQLSLHKLELEERELRNKQEQQIKLEEELEKEQEKRQALQEKSHILDLAKQGLQEAYEEMQETVTPRFTDQLSATIGKISNGKYQKVKLNSKQGLIVELTSGEYVCAQRLSIGTIDQLYFSLRLALAKELCNEPLPLFLDEAFAYYDDERLEQVLLYLAKEIPNQILLFTCTNREKKLLDKNNLPYHYVEL